MKRISKLPILYTLSFLSVVNSSWSQEFNSTPDLKGTSGTIYYCAYSSTPLLEEVKVNFSNTGVQCMDSPADPQHSDFDHVQTGTMVLPKGFQFESCVGPYFVRVKSTFMTQCTNKNSSQTYLSFTSSAGVSASSAITWKTNKDNGITVHSPGKIAACASKEGMCSSSTGPFLQDSPSHFDFHLN